MDAPKVADGRIYVTKTIRDMLIGSNYSFADSGSHLLKGFDEEWRLFRISAD